MKKFLLPVSLLIPFLCFSQYTFYNLGAGVYIQKNALVHVQGDFTNNPGSGSTAVIQNEGMLEVKGDFINQTGATFQSVDASSTNRAVKFVGTGKQHIIGDINTAGTKSIYNLVVSQGSAADSVEMQNDVLVEGSLVFGASVTSPTYNPTTVWTDHGSTGLLKTFADNSDPTKQYLLRVENGDVNAIKGYPTLQLNGNPSTGFILNQGPRGNPGSLTTFTGLQRNVTGTGAYVYPIGTIDHGFNAVNLNITNLPAGAQDIVATFSDGTSNSNGFEGNLGMYCNACTTNSAATPDNNGFNYLFNSNPCASGQEFWMILEKSTRNHGYWNIATNGGSNKFKYWAEVFMNNFNDNGSPAGTWRVLRDTATGLSGTSGYYYDPTNDNWTPQVLSISAVNDLVTYSAFSGNCYLGLGVPGGQYFGGGQLASFRENSNNALPVTLLDLSARPIDNKYIQVVWATSLEINNSGFEVERSADGINFTNIGWVAGHGNSTATQNYTYNDNNVTPDVVYYYKLRQMDFNGNTNETGVVSAEITGSGYFAVSDFVPNPSRDNSRVIVTTGKAMNIEVKFYDVIAQQLTAGKTYSLIPGENDIDFQTQNFAAGNYTAVISAGDKVYSKRLVIVKE